MAGFTPLPPMDGAALRTRSHGVRRDLAAVLETVWRRKWLPLMGLGAGLALGLFGMVASPPLYSASAQIMIENTPLRSGVLQSEVAIARSVPVMSKVAGMLRLYQDRDFSGAEGLARLWATENDENEMRDRVLGRLSRMVDVRILKGTSIIDMTARHSNPDRAAQIANAFLAAYQERKVDERFEQTRQIGGWMSKRLESIRNEGQNAKYRLEAFQAAHGPVTLSADIRAGRMMMLNQSMQETQAQIADLTARLEDARIHAEEDAATAARVQQLKRAEAKARADIDALSGRYGAKHPRMVEARAELARTRAALARVPGQAAPSREKSIARDLAQARARVDELQRQIDDVTVGADTDGLLKTELKNLEADVAANERLYADFLVKYQDVLAETELRMTDIKVISMATIPSRPDHGARVAAVLTLGALGFLAGLLAVLLRIVWARGFTDADQLETMTGYPVFAAIPLAARSESAVHHNVLQDPAAILAESLRSLRVSLRLRGGVGNRPRVVAFTSTLPDEGKTSMAVMLAMIAAKSGERVCVVDCDLRRPSLHKAFSIGNARGLADYLSDRLTIDEVIHRKDPSGVHLVTAKAVPSYSLTLLTSGRMERLIDALREQYDLVILDAPSSLAFADARVLAKMVDQTLYVVAWNRTRRDSVMASLKAYADMGYADLALVMNKVDLNEYLRDSASAIVYRYGRELAAGGGAEAAAAA